MHYVEDIFQTDPTSSLGLEKPVTIGHSASIGTAFGAVQRVVDIMQFLAEAFPAQVLNLLPWPDQKMVKPEGS